MQMTGKQSTRGSVVDCIGDCIAETIMNVQLSDNYKTLQPVVPARSH